MKGCLFITWKPNIVTLIQFVLFFKLCIIYLLTVAHYPAFACIWICFLSVMQFLNNFDYLLEIKRQPVGCHTWILFADKKDTAAAEMCIREWAQWHYSIMQPVLYRLISVYYEKALPQLCVLQAVLPIYSPLITDQIRGLVFSRSIRTKMTGFYQLGPHLYAVFLCISQWFPYLLIYERWHLQCWGSKLFCWELTNHIVIYQPNCATLEADTVSLSALPYKPSPQTHWFYRATTKPAQASVQYPERPEGDKGLINVTEHSQISSCKQHDMETTDVGAKRQRKLADS